MLDDRDYMRSDDRPSPLSFFGGTTSVTIVLIITLAVAFVLQQLNAAYFHFPIFEYLALSAGGLGHGFVWQLFTFQFLHLNLVHLLFNLLGLWIFGRYAEERLGTANFLKLYFLSGVAGGVLQAVLGWTFPNHFGGVTLGASAGICGLAAAFSVLEPEATILVFFVLPVRAKYLLYISIAIAVIFTVAPGNQGVAHAAHLGGLLFGAAFARWGIPARWQQISPWRPFQARQRKRELVKAASIKPGSLRKLRPKSEEPVELPSEEFITQQVDPILDKISAHGIQSLTERERQILQAARNKMTKK